MLAPTRWSPESVKSIEEAQISEYIRTGSPESKGGSIVISFDRALRGREAPSPEEFVTAVIHVHERVIARLKALASSTSPVGHEVREDAEIIQSYSALEGVNVGVADFEKGLAHLDRQAGRTAPGRQLESRTSCMLSSRGADVTSASCPPLDQ
jgi:hypothetical protein